MTKQVVGPSVSNRQGSHGTNANSNNREVRHTKHCLHHLFYHITSKNRWRLTNTNQGKQRNHDIKTDRNKIMEATQKCDNLWCYYHSNSGFRGKLHSASCGYATKKRVCGTWYECCSRDVTSNLHITYSHTCTLPDDTESTEKKTTPRKGHLSSGKITLTGGKLYWSERTEEQKRVVYRK